MIEAIKEFFMMLGMCVVEFAVCILLYAIISKFNRWRKNGCKIKCLCKPHKYKLVWYWRNTEEAILENTDCMHRKSKTKCLNFGWKVIRVKSGKVTLYVI